MKNLRKRLQIYKNLKNYYLKVIILEGGHTKTIFHILLVCRKKILCFFLMKYILEVVSAAPCISLVLNEALLKLILSKTSYVQL